MKITAKFKGEHENLKMFLSSGITDYSSKFLGIQNLAVEWFIDEERKEKAIEECMSLINTYQMELWNVDFESIQ